MPFRRLDVLSEWMRRLAGWLVVPTRLPLVVVGMESMSLRIRLELWLEPLAYFGSLLLQPKQREPNHANRQQGHYLQTPLWFYSYDQTEG